MTDRSRNDFNAAATLTVEARISGLSEIQQNRITSIAREADEKKMLAQQGQERSRQQDAEWS